MEINKEEIFNEQSFEVERNLACKIGFEEAIIYTFINNNIQNSFILKSYLYDNLKMFSEKTIDRYLNKLSKLKLIKIGLSPIEKYNIISSKNLEGRGIGSRVCEWCGGSALIMHYHHFPIQKKDGGSETVSICPTCHCEFHSLDSAIFTQKEVNK